jgi:ankyrin repeat protein
VIIYLIENYKPNLNEHPHDGMTPMHEVIMQNRVSLVEFMLSKGADPLLVDEDGLNLIETARDEKAYHDIHNTGIDYTEMMEMFKCFKK